MIRGITFIVLLLPVLVPLPGCKPKEEARPATPPEVEVVSVEQKDVPIYRDWVGTLQGEVNATISAQVTGYLISRAYKEGSPVTNGQVLFLIEPASFDAALARAKAQLTEAEAHKGKTALDVQRYTPLAKTQAISQQELDDAIQSDKAAQGQVESAQAAVQTASLNLGFTTIRSPVDGLAGLANAQIGDLVGPATGQLTSVAQINPIRVYFSVSQQLMIQMQERRLAEGKPMRTGEGPELELILASGATYPFKGRFRFAGNQVDVKTGTITVVGEFDNPQSLLVPGMFTRVRALLYSEPNALLVPQRAVTDMQGRYLIAIVGTDDKVSIRPVNVGEQVGPDWVISGDVKPGERVIVQGVQKIRQGSQVKPVRLGEKPAMAPATKAEEK